MRGLSLFSGVGGFDIAMDSAGIEVVGQVEIDPHCVSVLERHWPTVPRWRDVNDVGSANLPAFDVLTGGFPCQDISVAGKRLGLAGDRSGLWYEYARIIAECRPTWVVIENVAGLLSSNGGRDMGAILGTLALHGYGFAYRVLDAQWWGVAQRRRRVFIVGHLGGDGASEVLAVGEGSAGDPPPSRQKGQGVAVGVVGSPELSSPVAGPLGSLTDGGGFRTTDLDGNAAYVVPFTQNVREEVRIVGDGEIAMALQAEEGSHQRTYLSITPEVANPLTHRMNKGVNSDLNEGQTLVGVDLFNQTLTGDLHVPLRTAQGHGAPAVMAFNLQPDDRGVVPGAIRAVPTVVSATLDATTGAEKTDRGTLIVVFALTLNDPSRSPQASEVTQQYLAMLRATSTVRRLTPLEYARLQSFPDTWTEGEDADAAEAHAREVLCRLWSAVASSAGEGQGSRVVAALLTPEVLLAGVYGGWISWQVAAECAASRGQIPGEDSWPEGFVRGLWVNAQHRPSPYRRESFAQLARELGRPLSALPLEEASAAPLLRGSPMWTEASQEWLVRHACAESEALGRPDDCSHQPTRLSDAQRYRQMGNALAVPVAEWILKRIVEQEKKTDEQRHGAPQSA